MDRLVRRLRVLRPILLWLPAALLAAGCGGGGAKDFSNSSLVTLSTSSVPAGATGQPYAAQLTAEFPHPPGSSWSAPGGCPRGSSSTT